MSTSRVALPPGIYSIQTTESTPRAVINPSGQGQQLRVDRVNLTDAAQQWVIGGDGSLTPMNAANQCAATSVPSFSAGPVTRAATPYRWVVNVTLKPDGTFAGWIMCSDTGKFYWGLNGNNIQLDSTLSTWVFHLLPA